MTNVIFYVYFAQFGQESKKFSQNFTTEHISIILYKTKKPKSAFIFVRAEGFEPPTICLKGSCSTRLSYARILKINKLSLRCHSVLDTEFRNFTGFPLSRE
jgi:hypothetical protein